MMYIRVDETENTDMKSNAVSIKVFLLLLAFTVCAAPAFAQDHVIQKPVRPEKKQETTTTTKPKANTNTNTNKSSSSTSTNTQESSRSTTATPVPKPTTGVINGHEWVDLGLSVKWATCNVGASSPSDYGDYYAWGETSTKSSYTEANSKTYGRSMGDIAGNPAYDAARANWGGTWRLPTAREIDELVDRCTWTWTTQGGHNGCKVRGPNGNSIFLPAAGWRNGTSLYGAGEGGYYWGATPCEDGTYGAYGLYFGSDGRYGGWYYRHYGRSVRPVSE